MTQAMSSDNTIKITYYRKQTQPHPSHDETGQFTQDAELNYSEFNHIELSQVEKGTFRSSQGIPTGGKTFEI